MPKISEFYGIVIYMYARDHPVPHFHARYAEHEAKVSIASGEVLRGYLPMRVRRMVRHWARLHRLELIENWGRLRLDLDPKPIDPLP